VLKKEGCPPNQKKGVGRESAGGPCKATEGGIAGREFQLLLLLNKRRNWVADFLHIREGRGDTGGKVCTGTGGAVHHRLFYPCGSTMVDFTRSSWERCLPLGGRNGACLTVTDRGKNQVFSVRACLGRRKESGSEGTYYRNIPKKRKPQNPRREEGTENVENSAYGTTSSGGGGGTEGGGLLWFVKHFTLRVKGIPQRMK